MTVKYIDESRITAVRQSKAPLNYSRTGYGGKIGTSWEVQYAGRWRRVYVMQWSNAGTAYIIAGKERLLLGSFDPRYFKGAQGSARRRARSGMARVTEKKVYGHKGHTVTIREKTERRKLRVPRTTLGVRVRYERTRLYSYQIDNRLIHGGFSSAQEAARHAIDTIDRWGSSGSARRNSRGRFTR